ncbi:MAG TPA: tetratricopeptide repeat protein [Bryobacteraceae bacterium]|jgi:tetratricopeptide (TPR) repeat protein
MIGHPRAFEAQSTLYIRRASATALLSFGLAFLPAAPAFAQAQTQVPAAQQSDRAQAYYDFAMAHLDAELAGAYGNRGEYVNKAIDFYRQAMKADPSASYIAEELTEFYVQTGNLDKAMQEANDLLKANPANNNARKILARIYSRQIGDPDQGKVDQAMLKNAIEQYQKITQADPKDSESLSMLARLYRISHDDAAAEKTYRDVIALDPNDEDALNGLAMVYADRGDIPNAIAMLKQAIEKNPDPRTVVMLAEFYEQIKDFSNAADTMKQALSMTNDNVRIRRALAVDLFAAGRLDEALTAFQELAGDDPRNVPLQLQIAEILERKHDFKGAGDALAKAHAVQASTEVRFAEEELLRLQGKTKAAIAAMQALLNETKKDTYPDQEKLQRLRMLSVLGKMQEDAGNTPEAVAAFRQISDIDSSLGANVEYQVIEAYRNGKDYKLARQEADAALKKFSGDRGLVLEHALLMADLGQTDPAVNELRGLSNFSKDRDALITLAQVQDKAKRFDDERRSLDSADSLSKSPEDKQTIEFARGAMYEREKNFDAAEKAFRSVLEVEPENPGALNYLGYMYADRGVRLEEAQQMILKALNLDPDNGAYQDSLGWVYFKLNKLDEAADELRLAVDKVGKDPTVHDHLAEVYFKQGKFREAIQQWEASIAEWKTAVPGDQDPVELAKVTKKLEGARVRVSEKAPAR